MARFFEEERKKLMREKAKLEEEINSIRKDRSLTDDTKDRLIKVLKDVILAVERELENLK